MTEDEKSILSFAVPACFIQIHMVSASNTLTGESRVQLTPFLFTPYIVLLTTHSHPRPVALS